MKELSTVENTRNNRFQRAVHIGEQGSTEIKIEQIGKNI